MTTYTNPSRTSATYTNQGKNVTASRTIYAGNPMGLLLLLTYPDGFIIEDTSSPSYTSPSKSATSYTNPNKN